MRLVDYLICLLQAHAQTLQRLGAIFGEDILVEILENAGGDDEDERPIAPALPAGVIAFGKSPLRGVQTGSAAYAELESAVRDLRLPAMLEFHLWAYPPYRAFIESPLDLTSTIQGARSEAALALVDEAVAQAEQWIKKLHIPPELWQQSEQAAKVPWLRFRTEVFRRIGRRPMGPIG